ncbi:helix-turn-helix domain-containing protein [Peribacillus loiseleuriae]|uniref:helix-turn-helix domain-containing protein n=1 Tax=Peribacillus loiseleuriae TaxID=1679170 RepID=UPI003CFC66CC
MKNIGLIIQERRKQLNISQKELADKLGVTNSFLSKIESGKSRINLKRLSQIGDILSLDIFNYGSEIVEKWQPVIDMFEDIEVSPDDIMMLKEFLTQVKQIR